MHKLLRNIGFVLVVVLTCGSSALNADEKPKDEKIRRLTFTFGLARFPVYSPAGKERIAFSGFAADDWSRTGIWVADGKGKNPVLIAPGGWFPQFSPKGDKIAYRNFRDGELYIVNVDGSDPVLLSGYTSGTDSFSFSPDGSRIAFSAQPGPGGCCFHAAFIVNTDGTGLRQLSNLPEDNVQNPVFSPDGRTVAVAGPSQFLNGYGIWLLDADSGEHQRILDGVFSFNYGFNFSPDGETIYFLGVDLNRQSDIYSIRIDGTRLTNLTGNPNQQKSSPMLSPDGCQIVFEDFPEFWIMDADGSNRRIAIELADSTDRIETSFDRQAWSRDGVTFVFTSHRDNPDPFFESLRMHDIYAAKLSGKCREKEKPRKK